MAGAAARAPPGYYDRATGAFVHPGDAGAAKLASPPGPPVGVPPQIRPGSDEVYQLVQDLRVMERREHALLELSKRRETRSDLAPILWHSFGTPKLEVVC